MKSFVMGLAIFAFTAIPAAAQDVRVGISGRNGQGAAVDVVAFAPTIKKVTGFAQASVLTLSRNPEMMLGFGLPVVDRPFLQIEFDNAIGWYPTDTQYGTGVYTVGTMLWVPVTVPKVSRVGIYGMYFITPTVSNSKPSITLGIFKRVW